MSDHQTAVRQFRSTVAQQKVDCDGAVWTYFDDGPRNVPPLILLHGTSGTADSFFRQFLTLVPRGYRLVSAQWPPLWSVGEWVKSFDRFLDVLKIDKAHLFGTGLGGYLSLCYAQYRSNRIASIVLNNAFIDTRAFYEQAPCFNMIKYTPLFVLQRQVLKNLPSEAQEVEIANSIDFMVEQLEVLTQSELASRLILNCADNYVHATSLKFDGKAVTMIDVLDKIAVPAKCRDEMYKFFPDAKLAHLRTGGNFPFLSRSDEVNMHIQVHLRAHGIIPHHPADPNAAAPVPDKLAGVPPAPIAEMALPAAATAAPVAKAAPASNKEEKEALRAEKE